MAKAKALFLVNGGHAKLGHGANREILEDVLIHQAGLDLTTTPDHSELLPERLGRYDLIVDYSGHARVEPTDEQLDVVMSAVEAGLPYIALHVASLPFKSQLDYRKRLGYWPEKPQPNDLLNATQLRYFEMIGSAFITHGPIETFALQIVDREHPITRGVADFEITDELYQLGGDRAGLHLLAQAEGQPLLYTHTWSKGKVHYNALGHDQRALSHPSYQQLLKQAIVWALD